MSQVVLWLVLICLFTWCVAPRVFRCADSLLIRKQLGGTPLQADDHFINDLRTNRTKQADIGVLASLCDSLARLIRGGANSHDAVISLLNNELLTEHWWGVLSSHLQAGITIEESLQATRNECDSPDHHLFLTLMLGAIVHGNFVAAALDHASSVLRDRENSRSEAIVAASQSRFSTRLLSLLPILILGGSIFLSQTFRNGLFTAPILVPLVIGLILNRIGWSWSLRLIQQTTKDAISEVELLTNHLCVSLRAGYSMWQSCDRWNGVSDLGSDVSLALHSGQSLEDALLLVKERHPQTGSTLVDVILQADRDGLPVVNTVHRLATESQNMRRHAVDIRVRQLPTRLSLPLVFCVLPSFLLLTIAPLVISHLSNLTVSLPPLQQ